ncbi:hypothetical protein [Pyrococcus kukulkanii]|uniref:Uncharacterized protein n=1 Tax=Pyrococcus kukulkanii TaxID=1609559 RepID=A0A127B8A7_9EURY|nr:hypothetical protein [Pyrococcus kukulkanii]AMM53495.1 hypothetical protein TQ32_02570 [Pyrococcus kukulkanii]
MNENEIPNIIERRHMILQIIISAIFMAIAAGIISTSLVELMNTINLSVGVKVAISILIITLSMLWLATYYLGETVTIDFPMTLLVNKESGEFYPHDYFPCYTAHMVGYSFKQEAFNTKFDLNSPILQDLIEWILIKYLQRIHVTQIISPTVGRKSPVMFPGPMSYVDLSTVFRDNTFIKEFKKQVKGNEAFFHTPMPKEVTIEQGKNSRDPITARAEVVFKGRFSTPLAFLSITITVEGTWFGAPLLLWLNGYTPKSIDIGGDRIICKEKIISGKEAKELMKWLEIRCIVTIKYKMRGWMFFHPKFKNWYLWAQDLVSHAKSHLDFNEYLKEKRNRKLYGCSSP